MCISRSYSLTAANVLPALGDYVGRGVITTSTYEARALGVFSGMGLMKSAQLAPDASSFPRISMPTVSIRAASKLQWQASPRKSRIGESMRSTSTSSDIPEHSDAFARGIKQAVLDATGLTCSIGITPNELLSKICSDLDKPNGITILGMEEIAARIWPLPALKRSTAFAPRLLRDWHSSASTRSANWRRRPTSFWFENLGVPLAPGCTGSRMASMSRPVVTASEPKSISRESTFERDLHARQDRAELSEIFTALCLRVADDLKRKGYLGRTIGIKLRYSDFHAVTRDVTLPAGVSDALEIRKAAGECLKRVPLQQRIRLLGVRAGGLVPLGLSDAHCLAVQAELPL